VPLSRQQSQELYIMQEVADAQCALFIKRARDMRQMLVQVPLTRQQLGDQYIMREGVNTTNGAQAEEGQSESLQEVNMWSTT